MSFQHPASQPPGTRNSGLQSSGSPRLAAPFVLVTGGKGGVGKSTLAANLGVQLAREGRRVLVVDLDLGLANLNVLLGLGSGPTVEDALEGDAAFTDCVRRGPGGVDVLVAGSGNERMAALSPERRTRFLGGLRDLSERYELVLGDSAAGIGTDVLSFAALADRVLVVTTPELPALTDAYGLIKALDQYGARTGGDIPTPEVVVNQSSGVEEGHAIAHKLRSICERFLARSPRQAGWIPRSRSVAESAARQAPFALSDRRALEQLCLSQISGRLVRLCAAPLASGLV